MLSKAHHSKRETNRKKAIPSVTSIKDNANRNISHSGTCTGLKRKWTPIASDRDIAQLVRIAPRFRSERAWNPASHWAKKAKNRRAKASRTEGSLARGKSTARRFFAVSPRLVKPVPVLLLNQPISVPLQIPPSVKQMLRRNSSFTSARTQSCINCTSK